MNSLSVFSQKLGCPVPISIVGESVLNNKNFFMATWTNGSWSNTSDHWMDNGWNNSDNWTDNGWNNSNNWTDNGWSNTSDHWIDNGWSNG